MDLNQKLKSFCFIFLWCVFQVSLSFGILFFSFGFVLFFSFCFLFLLLLLLLLLLLIFYFVFFVCFSLSVFFYLFYHYFFFMPLLCYFRWSFQKFTFRSKWCEVWFPSNFWEFWYLSEDSNSHQIVPSAPVLLAKFTETHDGRRRQLSVQSNTSVTKNVPILITFR